MRGIGKGQTIDLLISPEVKQLIINDMAKIDPTNSDGEAASSEADAEVAADADANTKKAADWPDTHLFRRTVLPRRVAAWLQLQQMRSERMQYKMLQLQNLANIWRKPAFRWLSDNLSTVVLAPEDADTYKKAHSALVDVFKEPLGMEASRSSM